jgi:hypothetical protein
MSPLEVTCEKGKKRETETESERVRERKNAGLSGDVAAAEVEAAPS